MSPRKVVIVGYGMAGVRLAEDIRRRDPSGELVALTVLDDEGRLPYNRVLLSGVVEGTMSSDSVLLQDCGWAAAHHVDLRRGVGAVGLDRSARTVTLADESTVDYDDLVLATGAGPWVPPVDGLRTDDGALSPGVMTFRSLDDCERIAAAARPGARVVVLGGGLLGLEAARALAGRGCDVTVVHPVGHLMERQLDVGAGRVLGRGLPPLGIRVRLDSSAVHYVHGDGLKLDDGSHVRADLVVVSAGVRPRTRLARQAGLVVDGGVVIDDRLRTSDPRIHAIGDCARHPGTMSGFVQPAWEQAAVLADLLTGANSAATYHGTRVVTRLKARGIDLTALGDVHADPFGGEAEVLCLADAAGGRYLKLVVRDGRVTGAILLGAPDAAAAVTQLFDRGAPAPADRLALLLGRAMPAEGGTAASAAELPGTAVVCRCNTVTKNQLTSAWRGGARDLGALSEATRATTGCGSCRDSVRLIIDRLASSEQERPVQDA